MGNETKTITALQEVRTPEHLVHYENALAEIGLRTSRGAAKSGYAPNPEVTQGAVAVLREKVKPGFIGMSQENSGGLEVDATFDLNPRYWERALRVGIDHGAVHTSPEEYFLVSTDRSFELIKEDLEKQFAPNSVGGTTLESIVRYHEELGLNPALAARIVANVVEKGLPAIAEIARSVKEKEDSTDEAASAEALVAYLHDAVTTHIDSLREKHGDDPHDIAKAMNKASFYTAVTPAETLDNASLTVSQEDGEALTKVLNIQSRPYSHDELMMANTMMETSKMRNAIIATHEKLVAQCEQYLTKHPDHMLGDMASWSEIFVPETNVDGEVVFLPNPKLLRAIATNILPAVSTQLIARGASIEDITTEDLHIAIKVASTDYKLFQSKVVFMNYAEDGRLQLRSLPIVTCPANKHLPAFLEKHLPDSYEVAV